MSFKYVNPGYGNLLDVEGGTTVEDKRYSKTGVSFFQPAADHGLMLSQTPTELYGKFDVYLSDESNFEMEIGISGDFVHIEKSGKEVSIALKINSSGVFYAYANITDPAKLKQKTGLVMNTINTIWFHIQSYLAEPSGKGSLAIDVNGVEMANRIYNLGFYDYKEITVYSNNDKALLSNVIISDEPIAKKEQVIFLPVKDTETDMTPNEDGIYTAAKAGQQILQSVDTESLIDQYGAESKIMSIVTIGNPAYRTADGLSSLTGISKCGEEITEHGKKDVPQSTTAAIEDVYNVDMSMADLEGMKFGWKAGE